MASELFFLSKITLKKFFFLNGPALTPLHIVQLSASFIICNHIRTSFNYIYYNNDKNVVEMNIELNLRSIGCVLHTAGSCCNHADPLISVKLLNYYLTLAMQFLKNESVPGSTFSVRPVVRRRQTCETSPDPPGTLSRIFLKYKIYMYIMLHISYIDMVFDFSSYNEYTRLKKKVR